MAAALREFGVRSRTGPRKKKVCRFLLIILLLLVASAGCSPHASALAREGLLDLSGWDPVLDEPVELRGSYQAFWNVLLTPSQLASTREPVRILAVPGQWANFTGLSAERAGRGAATYRLTVRLARPARGLALLLPEPKLALRAWVNGVQIAERGRPALSAAEERASLGTVVVSVPDGQRELSLVVQLSNHGSRTGGFASAPLLGRHEAVLRKSQRALMGTAFLSGVLLIIALYHFGVSFLGPDGAAQRLLALNALAVGVHNALANDGSLTPLLPSGVPIAAWYRLEYFALYLSMPVGVALACRLYPAESRSWWLRLWQLLGFGFAGLALLAPVEVYTRVLGTFGTCAMLALGSVGITLVLAVKHRRPQARFVLFSFVVYVLASAHDVLIVHGLIPRMLSAPRGPSLLLFIGSQAWSLARRFAAAGRQVVELSADLKLKNQDLLLTNQSIARFVPNELLALLGKGSVRDVERGDQVERTMEVLFCDIRDFTQLVEAMPPGQAFGLINHYLGEMEPAIHEHGGFINQYLGDCIMALFARGADAAIDSALSMLTRLEQFNSTQTHSASPIRVGIGINAGPVIVGAIGGLQRLDSGVVGDAANLAARVESMTKVYGCPLIISEHVVSRLQRPSAFSLRLLDRVVPKGKSQPVSVFEVLDALPPARRALRESTRDDFQLGVTRYREGALLAAREAFARVLRGDPADCAAQLYVQRCRDCLAEAGENPESIS